mgnify:CR=1 FL=1
MYADYNQYQKQPQKNINFKFGLALILCIALGVCAAFYGPSALKSGNQHLQKNLWSLLPSSKQVHDKIIIPIQPHQVLFHQVEKVEKQNNLYQYLVSTPCIEDQDNIKQIIITAKNIPTTATTTILSKNGKNCTIVNLGPYKNYTETQNIHLAMQAANIEHTVYTER